MGSVSQRWSASIEQRSIETVGGIRIAQLEVKFSDLRKTH